MMVRVMVLNILRTVGIFAAAAIALAAGLVFIGTTILFVSGAADVFLGISPLYSIPVTTSILIASMFLGLIGSNPLPSWFRTGRWIAARSFREIRSMRSAAAAPLLTNVLSRLFRIRALRALSGSSRRVAILRRGGAR